MRWTHPRNLTVRAHLPGGWVKRQVSRWANEDDAQANVLNVTAVWAILDAYYFDVINSAVSSAFRLSASEI